MVEDMETAEVVGEHLSIAECLLFRKRTFPTFQ